MPKFLLALGLSVTFVSVCFAGQDTAATVTVHVEPATPDAALTLVALAQPALSLTVSTGAGAEAIFRHIPPGRYRIVLQRPGVADVAAEASVAAGATEEWVATVTLAPGGTAGLTLRPLDRRPPGNTHVFDQETLRSFPADDMLWSVVETGVASVIVDRISTGGLWAGEAARLGGNAASWRQTAISRGDFDVTDPLRAGTPMLRANHGGADALMVTTSMLPPSAAGPGPLLTLLPRVSTPAWSGDATVGTMPALLRASRPITLGVPAIAEFTRHHDAVLDAGGPLTPRAGIFVSVRHSVSGRLEMGDPTPLETSATSLSADLALQTRSDAQLQVAATFDRAHAPYAGRARLSDASARQADSFGSAHATWQGWTSAGSGWSASAGFIRGAFDPQLTSAAAGIGTVERLDSGPIPSLFELPSVSRRWSARLDAEPALRRFPRHLVRAGVSVAGNASVTTPAPLDPAAELVDGIPARVWEYRFIGSNAHANSTEVSGYVSDGVDLGSRGRLDAGLRMESISAGTDLGRQISWFSATPRLSARWAVDSAGRYSAFGGFSQYADRLPLDVLAHGDNSGLSGDVYRWVDGNGDGQYQPAERASLVAKVGPCCVDSGVSSIDPQLKRPITNELTVGVDVRIGGWSGRIAILHRRTHGLIGLLNTGVSSTDYTTRLLPDAGENVLDPSDDRLLPVYDRTPASFGKDRYLLTNPDTDESDQKGIELTIEGHPIPAVSTRFDGVAYTGHAIGANRGYGALENDPGVLGEAFAVPNAATYSLGHPMLERQYVAKWWTSYLAPRAWVLTGVVRYQDGQPFARMVVVPDLNQGAEAIQAYRRGRTRFAFTFSLDAHVEKAFSIRGISLAGIVEVFNLANTSKEVAEDVLTGPAFRTSTAIQPPRTTRLGVRLTF